jgi:hypothetical protein
MLATAIFDVHPFGERAKARFGPDIRGARWQRRVGDLVAGAPSDDD